MAAILAASAICFSVLQARPVIHEILIALFVTLTTPVTLMLLARAAIYRDRSEASASVPSDPDSDANRMISAPNASTVKDEAVGPRRGRSEERRVGKEGVGTFSSRWSPYH